MTVVPLHNYTIGGSDAAAAAGIDPHKSRVMLYLEKTGRVERPETERRMSETIGGMSQAEFDARLDAYQATLYEEAAEAAERSYETAARPDAEAP